MKTIRKTTLLFISFLLMLNVEGFSQIYSYRDIINQYDPFTLTINDMVLNTNDEEIKEHAYVFIITATLGNEKVIKFLYRDDVIINSVKNYDDAYWALNISVRKNNSIILPASFNIPNNTGSLTLKLEAYTNVNELDQTLMGQLSTGFCYTSSSMYNYMEQAFKYIASSPDVNRPNSSLLTTAEVLQQNIKTRPGVFYLGNPVEVNYVIPPDPMRVIGTNLLIQGKKSIESRVSNRSSDKWNITFTKYTDLKIVQAETYYHKLKGVFQDLSSLTIISENRREGNLAKAQELMNDDLVVGRNLNIYINDQVVKQLSNVLNLVKAGVRAKSDTMQTTNELMFSAEREALSYLENNLKENELNLDNQYIFDDFIFSSVNRGIIQKEIDLIKRYYQIK